MDNVVVTLKTILALFGGITCIVGGISSITKLFSPFKELKKKVEDHDAKLDRDYKRMESFDQTAKEIGETDKIICKSLFALLNHEITGNSVDKLKEQRDALEAFIIDK